MTDRFPMIITVQPRLPVGIDVCYATSFKSIKDDELLVYYHLQLWCLGMNIRGY